VRTVITHFFNESYLLPWWLNHHLKLFDHGILIDHGSTDDSVDICRQLAPSWKVVPSKLAYFDAWLTDFEVMTHEFELPGWKVALNITEFLISNPGLREVEEFLLTTDRRGIAASGMTMVDKNPTELPKTGQSLILQKPWAVDDNRFNRRWMRQLIGYPKAVLRNRFYHSYPTGMYHAGRHSSFSIDWKFRTPNIMILHFGYSPWNEYFLERKRQIATKIPEEDRIRGYGWQHFLSTRELQKSFERRNRLPFVDLTRHEVAANAISYIGDQGTTLDADIKFMVNAI
jgi:hypothetical protein